MQAPLHELLQALSAAVGLGADTAALVDDIEAVIEDGLQGSRTVLQGYAGDEGLRLWGLGLIGDPRDFPILAQALADPGLRFTALEALANQPDADQVDAIARIRSCGAVPSSA